MKKYQINLKGSKKNNTNDLSLIMLCSNKSQAFNLAYRFFQVGDTNVVYGTEKTGLSTIHQWMPNAEEMKKYAGKYNVFSTSIKCL